MPTYDYKCEECGKVFEVFRRFNDYDKEIRCPDCGSGKTEIVFSIPQISGETVTGFGFKDEPHRATSVRGGMGRGKGLGRRRWHG